MDYCRLSVITGGAFQHPLGDVTPIDCRYSELLATPQLPHRQMLSVSAETLVSFGHLRNPRAVIVWNVSGQGLQVQPSPEEAAAIAAKTLQVGLVGDELEPEWPRGAQFLHPAKPGSDLGGNTILWLSPGTRVILRPGRRGVTVIVRVLVLPGSDS